MTTSEQQAVPVAQEVRVLEDEFYALSARAGETTPNENDDAYHVGVRDGYESAVQTVDMLTGGDGEYRFCMGAEDHASHCPDPPTMIRRIMDRILATNEQSEDPTIFKRQSPLSLPCKSGEGAGESCVRGETLARIQHCAASDPSVVFDANVWLNKADATAILAALTPDATQTREAEGEPYLVWSNEHRAWWGKDQRGYTRIIANAGRYDRDTALTIAGTRGGGWRLNKGNPDEIAIPEADAIDQYASITAEQLNARGGA